MAAAVAYLAGVLSPRADGFFWASRLLLLVFSLGRWLPWLRPLQNVSRFHVQRV